MAKTGIKQLQDAMKTAPAAASQGAARDKNATRFYNEAIRNTKEAAKLEDAADDQRSKFVTSFSQPDAALAAGRQVKSTLGRIEALYEHAESEYSSYLSLMDDLDDEAIEERNAQIRSANLSMSLPEDKPQVVLIS
jgi:hypothetical protein